jgi:hypothetical protein
MRRMGTIFAAMGMAAAMALTGCAGEDAVGTSAIVGTGARVTLSSISLDGHCSHFTSCGGNVQLTAEATGGSEGQLEIVSAELIAYPSQTSIGMMTATSPEIWDGTRYAAWNQRISKGAASHVSYRLEGLDWNKSPEPRDPFSSTYVVRVVIRLDGVERTLLSQEISLTPVAVT